MEMLSVKSLLAAVKLSKVCCEPVNVNPLFLGSALQKTVCTNDGKIVNEMTKPKFFLVKFLNFWHSQNKAQVCAVESPQVNVS